MSMGNPLHEGIPLDPDEKNISHRSPVSATALPPAQQVAIAQDAAQPEIQPEMPRAAAAWEAPANPHLQMSRANGSGIHVNNQQLVYQYSSQGQADMQAPQVHHPQAGEMNFCTII